MHPDEEQLQRLLHGELDAQAESTVRAHLAQCPTCVERLERARAEEGEVQQLLAALDGPVPHVTAEQTLTRAHARSPAWRRWAAGIVLTATAGGAAWALPGSPLPDWIRDATGPQRGTSTAAATDTDDAGIAIAAGKSLVVFLDALPARGALRIALIEGDDVDVRASSDAATFTSALDSLIVSQPAATDTVTIGVPRNAAHVAIHVGELRVFEKQGARITTSARSSGADAWIVLPL